MKVDRRRYINYDKDLLPLFDEYDFEEVKAIIIGLWLKEEGWVDFSKIKNKLILQTLSKIKETDILKTSSYFSKRKIRISLESVLELFDILISKERRDVVGIFHSPTFVADYLASEAITTNTKSVLDPASGTGSLLIAIAKRISELQKISFVSALETRVYGVDINPECVAASKLILSVMSLIEGENKEEINFNIQVANSLRTNFRKLFPRVFLGSDGFDSIICNPPFSGIENLKNTYEMPDPEYTKSGTYWPFIDLLFKIGNHEAYTSAYVVPLSVAYSKNDKAKQFRERILNSKAVWKFSFYDRSPDSLFGDKVKTRNCIFTVTYNERTALKIYTTQLRRWSYEQRQRLFEDVEYADISSYNISSGIPKISNVLELKTFRKLSRNKKIGGLIQPQTLKKEQSQLVKTEELQSRTLYYYPTAYNWIPIFRASMEESSSVNEGTFKPILCKTSDDADFFYGCLSSRITYWYWRILGDGFHLNFDFIKSLPFNFSSFSPEFKMKVSVAGKELSDCLIKHNIVKINSGKKIENYNVLACKDKVSVIDSLLSKEFGLDELFITFIEAYMTNLISAGRSSYKNKDYLESGKKNPADLRIFTKEDSKISKEEWKEFTKSVWYIANTSNDSHPAMFPVEIPNRLVKLFTFKGETVLDPFCGIGTTGKACVSLDRKFIGIDTNPNYIAKANQNLLELGISKDVNLYNKDSRNLSFINDSTVDLIVTSPPYWNKADYGNYDSNVGAIDNYTEFLDQTSAVFKECLRVLKPGKRMCIVTANVHQYTQEGLITFPLSTDFTNKMRTIGFLLVNEIIWSKDGTGGKWGSYGKQRPIFGSYPYPPNFYFKNIHEYILIFKKPPNNIKPNKSVKPYKHFI
jgi:site-specific DNA-methyltransferase (adenine-specific)